MSTGVDARAALPWPTIASAATSTTGLDATPEQFAIVADLLAQVVQLDLISRLVHEYYACSQATVVPGPLLLPILSTLRDCLPDSQALPSQGGGDSAGVLSHLAERVVRSTSANIDISSSLSVSGFLAAYTGENLRLEAIGLIFAISARSCLLGLARDDVKHDEFVQTMFRSSTYCLHLARDFAPRMNDAIAWLSCEHLLLSMSIQGNASKIKDKLVPRRPY